MAKAAIQQNDFDGITASLTDQLNHTGAQ